MKPAPTLAAINAAELRVIRSRGNVRQSVERTRTALRTFIARPSTLVLVTVASGITAYLLTPRRRSPSVKSVAKPEESKLKASGRSLLRTFGSMYGTRLLTLVLQLGAAAGKPSPPLNATQASPSTPGDSANPGHARPDLVQRDAG